MQSPLTGKVTFIKTLRQQVMIMQVDAKIKFGQDHNTHEILVVTILSLETSVE
jgi:hypothetical protein